jgi:hypothetical protein
MSIRAADTAWQRSFSEWNFNSRRWLVQHMRYAITSSDSYYAIQSTKEDVGFTGDERARHYGRRRLRRSRIVAFDIPFAYSLAAGLTSADHWVAWTVLICSCRTVSHPKGILVAYWFTRLSFCVLGSQIRFYYAPNRAPYIYGSGVWSEMSKSWEGILSRWYGLCDGISKYTFYSMLSAFSPEYLLCIIAMLNIYTNFHPLHRFPLPFEREQWVTTDETTTRNSRRQLFCILIQPQIKDYVVEASIWNLDISNVRKCTLSVKVEEKAERELHLLEGHMEQRQS